MAAVKKMCAPKKPGCEIKGGCQEMTVMIHTVINGTNLLTIQVT